MILTPVHSAILFCMPGVVLQEESEKKPKVVIVKENITIEASITDIPQPDKDQIKASKKK